MLSVLSPEQIEYLVWRGPFSYSHMVRIGVPGDGSCFFHSILRAISLDYITRQTNNVKINRSALVYKFRCLLAARLSAPMDPLHPKSGIVYDHLSGGKLGEYARDMPQYSLENIQRALISGRPVGDEVFELVSNALDINIFVLSASNQDVVLLPRDELLYRPNRRAVILLFLSGHYELVGVDHGVICTFFEPQHDFIQALTRRMREKRSILS